MSAVIKTMTPLVVKEVLLRGLSILGYEPQVVSESNLHTHHHRGQLQIGDILTNREDYFGWQYFRHINGKWVLLHDADEMRGRITSREYASKHYTPVSQFLQELEKEYEKQYLKHLEELAELERQRLEEERKARVDAIRKTAVMQAKAKGYVVKEKLLNGKIQLVCTRSF